MPIYEYQCEQCGHHFEMIQKITDSPVKQCPVCLQDTAKKLVSAAGFQLKGSGWYETDFKNKGKPGEVKKSDSKSQSEAKPKDNKKESKS